MKRTVAVDITITPREVEKAEAEAREKRLEEEREEQARIWWER